MALASLKSAAPSLLCVWQVWQTLLPFWILFKNTTAFLWAWQTLGRAICYAVMLTVTHRCRQTHTSQCHTGFEITYAQTVSDVQRYCGGLGASRPLRSLTVIKGRPACHSCLMLLPVQKESNSLAWAERKATHRPIFTSNKPPCKCEYRFLRWGLESDLFNMNKGRSSAFHPHPQGFERDPKYKTHPKRATLFNTKYFGSFFICLFENCLLYCKKATVHYSVCIFWYTHVCVVL